jgi:hypothetical protein
MASTCFAEPQDGDRGLAAGAHRVKLAGPTGDLRYPSLCPNCGAAASEPLTIGKVFRDSGSSDTPVTHVVVEARPLFCRPCADRHRAETIRPTASDILRTALFSEAMIPAFCSLAAGLFLLHIASTIRGGLTIVLVPVGMAIFFLLIAYSSWRGAWSGTRWKRVPAQTDTSRAFDFGHDESGLYQTVARTYAFRNRAYAEAFAAANQALNERWLGPEQKARERRRFWIVAAIVIALVVIALLIGPPKG